MISWRKLNSFCLIQYISYFLFDLFPDGITPLIYVLHFYCFFNYVDHFASSDQSLSSDTFNSYSEQYAEPFIAVVINAFNFNISSFKL